jgi:hypothetical protein
MILVAYERRVTFSHPINMLLLFWPIYPNLFLFPFLVIKQNKSHLE